MTMSGETSNGKFHLKVEDFAGKEPKIHLTALGNAETITENDVAESVYRDCYVGDLGFNIRGRNASCIVKTKVGEYSFKISEPYNFESALSQVEEAMSVS